jgi:hypothetical protein
MDNLPHTFFSNYNIDFKAEVIAAEMIENGLDPERILILLTGAMKRSHRLDVTSIEEDLSEYDHKEYTLIKTSREGIYDMLPEGLFHKASAHKNVASEKEIIQSIKKRRQEEVNARKFFLPFETTINYLRVQMALYENMLDKRSEYDELVEIFSKHWDIFRYLDTRQANIFLLLMPVIHDLRGDFAAIEIILEAMFLLPASVTLQIKLPYRPNELIISNLGNSTLGSDLTTGNLFVDEGEEKIIVKIDCKKNQVFQQFMKGNTNEKVLQSLYDYLLPVHLDFQTIFEMDDNEKLMRLADGVSIYNSNLGNDTWL